jgi:hypothetical protein
MIKFLLSAENECSILKATGPNNSSIFHGIIDRDFRDVSALVLEQIRLRYPETHFEIVAKIVSARD